MLNQLIFVCYAFLNLLIALILYFKLKKNFVSQFYIILVVYLITFIGISSISGISLSHQLSEPLRGFLVFIYSMFPFIFLHFILYFIGNNKISKSIIVITAIYITGIISFTMIQFGFLPNVFSSNLNIQTSISIFYLTWMSILFAIGVSQLYSLSAKKYSNRFKTHLLFTGFVFLMLILPGPFSDSIFSSFLSNYSQVYFITSILALTIAVYILFKQKSSTQILSALKLSLKFLSDVILITDESFTIELAEGDIQKLFRLLPEELIGENLNELLLDSGYLHDYYQYSLDKKLTKGSFDAKYTSADGIVNFMNFSIAPILDNENLSGYILVGRDISERRQLENELRNSNEVLQQNVQVQTAELAEMNRRMHLDIEERKFTEERLRKLTSELKSTIFSRDKMFSIVAHDLRSPFVTLLGFSELLVQEIGTLEKDDVKQFSQNIFTSANRVYNLLENLLQWSRIQTGKIIFEPTELNLKTVVSENTMFFKYNADIKGVKIESKIDENIKVYADRIMLDTTIKNLISNAIKFTKSGGSVEVTSSDENRVTNICVADTGIGIPKENMPKIFAIDNFASTPDTENQKGSGLGLIIAKEFVEKNGGKLTLESEVDKGTTVKFTVPNYLKQS